MRLPLLIFWLCAAACAHAQVSGDPELKKLRAQLAAAEDQTTMNLTSKAVSDWLDKRLTAEEGKIRAKLEAKMVEKFDRANASWRDYRTAQTIFEGAFYDGGSIQPLIHNSVFGALTEARIDQLRAIYKENFEQ